MATKKKLLEAAAGAAGAAGGLNVEEVFSTYLYEGNGDGSAATNVQTINNGIDLSGEGGMVWIKGRSHTTEHIINDTERGANNALQPNRTDANQTGYYDISQFNSNGFGLDAGGNVNANGYDYASWTFRKAPKFFDVVTYTGTGNENNTINHNLGSVPGMIIVKRTDSTSEWLVYHRGVNGGTKPEQYNLRLQDTDAQDQNSSYFSNTAPTSTTFTVGSLNSASGGTYVAYLFAHNDGDGEFGPDGDADIIKCGTWTGTGSVMDINLGFEPQWIMYKRTDATGDWEVFDNMRGLVVGGSSNSTGQRLIPNRNEAEGTTSPLPVVPTPTGFRNESSFHYTSGRKFIYIAIRRGPMAVPTDATDVFAVAARTGTTASGSSSAFVSGFPVDFGFVKRTTGTSTFSSARLIQNRELLLNSTAAEGGATNYTFDSNTGMWGQTTALSDQYAWMWKRAPSFCDVVAYTGNGTAGRTVSHNLGVAPEMMWIKKRSGAYEWIVYSPAGDGYLRLNTTEAYATSNVLWNATSPTATDFTLGGYTHVNGSGEDYIAYLFASLDGVSKVGSYTGNGTSQTIDCGFSSGARFVLIKRATSAGANWYVFDTERGIVAGNDPVLYLNQTQAQWSGDDYIDPDSSGFQVTGDINGVNDNGDTFIFYAIA